MLFLAELLKFKSAFGRMWLAGTVGVKKRPFNKAIILSADIEELVRALFNVETSLSPRLSGTFLCGLCAIYNQKCHLFHLEVLSVFRRLYNDGEEMADIILPNSRKRKYSLTITVERQDIARLETDAISQSKLSNTTRRTSKSKNHDLEFFPSTFSHSMDNIVVLEKRQQEEDSALERFLENRMDLHTNPDNITQLIAGDKHISNQRDDRYLDAKYFEPDYGIIASTEDSDLLRSLKSADLVDSQSAAIEGSNDVPVLPTSVNVITLPACESNEFIPQSHNIVENCFDVISSRSQDDITPLKTPAESIDTTPLRADKQEVAIRQQSQKFGREKQNSAHLRRWQQKRKQSLPTVDEDTTISDNILASWQQDTNVLQKNRSSYPLSTVSSGTTHFWSDASAQSVFNWQDTGYHSYVASMLTDKRISKKRRSYLVQSLQNAALPNRAEEPSLLLDPPQSLVASSPRFLLGPAVIERLRGDPLTAEAPRDAVTTQNMSSRFNFSDGRPSLFATRRPTLSPSGARYSETTNEPDFSAEPMTHSSRESVLSLDPSNIRDSTSFMSSRRYSTALSYVWDNSKRVCLESVQAHSQRSSFSTPFRSDVEQAEREERLSAFPCGTPQHGEYISLKPRVALSIEDRRCDGKIAPKESNLLSLSSQPSTVSSLPSGKLWMEKATASSDNYVRWWSSPHLGKQGVSSWWAEYEEKGMRQLEDSYTLETWKLRLTIDKALKDSERQVTGQREEKILLSTPNQITQDNVSHNSSNETFETTVEIATKLNFSGVNFCNVVAQTTNTLENNESPTRKSVALAFYHLLVLCSVGDISVTQNGGDGPICIKKSVEVNFDLSESAVQLSYGQPERGASLDSQPHIRALTEYPCSIEERSPHIGIEVSYNRGSHSVFTTLNPAKNSVTTIC